MSFHYYAQTGLGPPAGTRFRTGLGQACVDHGQSGTSGQKCCQGLKAWGFDGKTGIPEPPGTFRCWIAKCIPEGMYAGPNGIGNHCCSGLVNRYGKCAKPAPPPAPVPAPQPPALPPAPGVPPVTTVLPPTPDPPTFVPGPVPVSPAPSPPVFDTPAFDDLLKNPLVWVGGGALLLLMMSR